MDASRIQEDAWLYFNHLRLFELANGRGVEFKKLRYYGSALAIGLIDANGMLRDRDRDWSYMYDDGDGITLYFYVRDVLHATLGTLTGLNISDMLDKGVLNTVVSPGDFIVLQGAYTFASNDVSSGRGQITTGHRSANHVEVEFTFDRWEATSTSAWARWLKGQTSAAALIRVVKVTPEKARLRIEGTVLAISQELHGLKTREYASMPYRQGVWLVDDDDGDLDEDS